MIKSSPTFLDKKEIAIKIPKLSPKAICYSLEGGEQFPSAMFLSLFQPAIETGGPTQKISILQVQMDKVNRVGLGHDEPLVP